MFTRHIKQKGIYLAIIAACLGVFAICGLSACQIQTKTEVDSTLTPKLASSATIHEGVLTVGINASNSPYGGTNTDKETVGLDVDVAAALAQELGLKLQIVDVSSSGRNALTNKQVDVSLGLMKSGTSDKVSYSDSYISDGPSLYCLSKNKPNSVESVASETAAGKAKVLVQADTTAAMKAQESIGVDKIVAKSTMQATFDALESGEQKYLVADAAIGDYFARNYEDVVRVGFLGADCVTPMYAVTLSQNSALSSGINTAMKTINSNGTMRVVVAKWLGTDGQTLLPGKIDLSKLPAKAFGL